MIEILSVAPNLSGSVAAPSPFVIATTSAAICLVGYVVFAKEKIESQLWHKRKSRKPASIDRDQLFIFVTISMVTFLIARLLTGSVQISFAIATLGAALPLIINKQRAESARRARELAWPETIDSLVSALQSGLSISDAVFSLSDHSPVQLRPSFSRIKQGVTSGKTLDEMLRSEKAILDSGLSDQVFETLLIAKEFGGKDSNNALRLLSQFIRDDIDALEEIRTKFGWIRNSAALASAAPWILLILLSSQQATVEAFAKPSGVAILVAGVLMTFIAYFWMDRVGQLPVQPRPLR